mgnify:CR=1 FL=1
MLMPSIFGANNMFDDLFDDDFFGERELDKAQKKLYGHRAKNVMNTDIKETDDGYELEMDLPGFKKDEIQIQLKNGYVTVSAAKGLDKDEKDKEGKYVRRERYAGNVSRSFYVGDNVRNEDIHPKFENGILSFTVPKEQKAIEDTTHYIAIEG